MSRTSLRLLSIALLLSGVGCSEATETAPGSDNPLADLATPGSDGPLTAAATAAEQAGKADGEDPRDLYPDFYGFTQAPPEGVRLPGEFEDVDVLLVSVPYSAYDYANAVLEVAALASQYTRVRLISDESSAADAYLNAIVNAGGTRSNIQLDLQRLDTVWVRDFGPMVVQGQSGTPYVIDARYYWGRWNDDYIPMALARTWGTRVARPPLAFEGGNLLSDGQGKCVTTDRLVRNNARDFGYGTEDLRDILRRYYGCTTTVFVPQLAGEGTGHVDMLVHITAAGKVMVGQYDPRIDATNAGVVDEAARMLTDAGFEVTRLPMPSNDNGSVFRSYTNALAVDDAVLVPVYAYDREYEAEALQIFQAAYPGRRIVPVVSDNLIAIGGAVHCVTMTVAEPFSG